MHAEAGGNDRSNRQADDEARAQISGQKVEAPSHPPGIPSSPRQVPPHDDVLLLTDLVEEPTKRQEVTLLRLPGEP